MNKIIASVLLLSVLTTPAFAAVNHQAVKAPVLSERAMITKDLTARFKVEYKNKNDILKLKADTLALSGKAVPALVEVMKNSSYPDRNRWIATFLLGRVMGAKSAPYIAKYAEHPNWIMRMASLKTLASLKQKDFGHVYARALNDESYIIRVQALDNVNHFHLTQYAPNVWAMLYDKKNYYVPKNVKKVTDGKRQHIIKKVITTVGDLEFKKSEPVLLKMVQNDKYKDIFDEMDYALSKITKKQSPKGNKEVKKLFWKRHQASSITI